MCENIHEHAPRGPSRRAPTRIHSELTTVLRAPVVPLLPLLSPPLFTSPVRAAPLTPYACLLQVFDRIPLSAVIDQDIFCVHGGIPRAVTNKSRIQDILCVPKVAGINPPYEHETEEYQQVASDCIWSDPASDEQEAMGVDPTTGFGEVRLAISKHCEANI